MLYLLFLNLKLSYCITYESGYTEKGYSVPKKFSISEEIIMTSYKYGEELRLERKKKSQVIISTVVILLVAGGAGTTIFMKRKKSYNKIVLDLEKEDIAS